MSFEMNQMRKSPDSSPVYSVYLRLGLGGLLCTTNNSIISGPLASGVEVGQPVSYNFGIGIGTQYVLTKNRTYTETLDERDDIVLSFGARLLRFPSLLLADGIQENNGMTRFKSLKKHNATLVLSNYDGFFSKWWGKEPFLGRDVYCKFGFLGLPYIYFYEIFRGTIIKVVFAQNKVTLVLEA